MKSISYSFLALLLSGCVHQNNTSLESSKRSIASEADKQYALSELVDGSQFYSEVRDVISKRNSNGLQKYFDVFSKAQNIVTQFKVRVDLISQLESGADVEMDRLNRSRLACEVMKTKEEYLSAESKFELLLQYARTDLKRSEAYSWVTSEMNQFAKLNPSAAAAISNALLNLKSKEQQLCGAENCVKEVILNSKDVLAFEWSNLEAQSKFLQSFQEQKKKTLSRLSRVALKVDPMMKAGSCFEKEPSRKPNQLAYDWKNRNWTGSTLAPNEFIVTYDDGPSPLHTDRIAKIWESAPQFAKPAFFWLSRLVALNIPLVQDLHLRGFPIASHSGRHPNIGNLAQSTSLETLNRENKNAFARELVGVKNSNYLSFRDRMLDSQIITSSAVIEDAVRKVDPDYKLKHFRLPYGSGVRNSEIGKRFAKANFEHMFWAVDSLDWQDKNPQSIRDSVLKQMRAVKRGIILFHDVHPQTVRATELLIEDFKANGTRIVSLSKLSTN